MKNPANLQELLNAQKQGEEVTFSQSEKTNVEIANDLLQECWADIKENCRLHDGYLIPAHVSSRMRLLGLIVKLAEDLERANKGDRR